MIKQNTFTYYFKDTLNEVDYFVNETNHYAFTGITNNYSKLCFLYGPNKSGKSFLGKIWQKKNDAVQFVNNFEYILSCNRNILIDDLKIHKQENIFFIINNCILNNLNILIISDQKINDIDFNFNDLSSRIKIFSNYEIKQPNDEMLLTILTKLLVDKQFIINSHEIFKYILRRVDRSYQGVHDIVNKLDILSLEKKRQLTIPLIKEIL